MTDIQKEYIVLKPAENSPWGKFLDTTITLDKAQNTPRGWHWLLAMYCLIDKFPNISTNELKKIISDYEKSRHKELTSNFVVPDYLSIPLQNLLKELGEPEKINEIDFSKLSFTENTTFLNFIFPVDVFFTGATFSSSISFNYADFLAHADFNNTKFSDTVTFGNATFCTADFSETSFSKNVSYYQTKFSKKVKFNKTEFLNGAHFSITKFFGTVTFNNANFYKGQFLTIFNKAVFSESARFDNAKFHGKVYFLETAFSKNAVFDNAIFSQFSDFQDATFSNNAFFRNATFSQSVHFTNATFSNTINFQNTDFNNRVIFTDTKFLNDAIFENSCFFNKAIFDFANITKSIDFTNANFKTYAPSFYDATIYPDISWDTAKWPSSRQFTYTKDLKKIQYNKNSYENLANHMKKADKYHDQHFFFRKEMRCRRKLDGIFSFVIYGLYQRLADYGYGVGRASFWWFANICFWASILYYWVLPDKLTPYEKITCSILTSVSNAHNFFLSKSDKLSYCSGMVTDKLTLEMIWALETIFGAFFLFLLLLTFRVRFRLQ